VQTAEQRAAELDAILLREKKRELDIMANLQRLQVRWDLGQENCVFYLCLKTQNPAGGAGTTGAGRA
jgi:hypothetical protein